MTPRTLLESIREREMKQVQTQAEIGRLWGRFGAAVREARRRLGVGATKFAGALGYSTGMLAFLETGKRTWTMEAAKKAVEILAGKSA